MACWRKVALHPALSMHSVEDSDVEKDGFRLICLRVTSVSVSQQRARQQPWALI